LQVFPFGELAEDPEFGDPIDLADQGLVIACEMGEGGFPELEEVVGFRIAPFEFCGCGVEEAGEQIEGVGGGFVGEEDGPGRGGLVGDLAEGGDGIGEGDVGEVIDFEEIKDQGGGADFEGGGDGQDGRIAMEEVEAAEAFGIGEGFVAGIDDGAIELHPLEEFVIDVIGALAELEKGMGAGAEMVAAVFGTEGGADAAGAGEEGAEGEEGEDGEDIGLGEGSGTSEEVIFVAAEGGAGVVVDVVADETGAGSEIEILEGLLDQQITGAVIGDEVVKGQALGGAIFEVAHIDIGASAVEEEAAVARGFIPIPLEDVGKAVALMFEEPVSDTTDGGCGSGGIGGEAAVFGFESDDAGHEGEGGGLGRRR
jgi:hypothetical protein